MTQEELKKIKDFYEKVILQQIILPNKIDEIYTLIHPEAKNLNMIAYIRKQLEIITFMNTQYKKLIDVTETALPKNGESETQTVSVDNEGQSHSEDYSDIYLGEDELEDEKTIWNIDGEDIEMVIEKECCSEEAPVKDLVQTPDGTVYITTRPTCEEVEAREKELFKPKRGRKPNANKKK